MILVDSGPLVALFDPKDGEHARCRDILAGLTAPLATTVAVLTEAFHILSPESIGSQRLRDFVAEGGLGVRFLDRASLERAFELMERYADHPMELADASLIATAESLRTRRVFTLDHGDFSTYRIRLGHRHERVQILL